jgi:5-formyltetrahydrofolate cyclo-ligase
MLKSEIRKKVQLQRDNVLSDNESKKIAENIFKLFSGNEKFVASFIPISDKNEVDTWQIKNYLSVKGYHPIWLAPVMRKNEIKLDFYPFNHQNELVEAKFGVLEPKVDSELLVHPQKIDFWIVPLLACDTRGNRVGYGKGYYDKTLAEANPKAPRVGVSWFNPIELIEDINEFDVPLTHLVTPSKVFCF